MPGSEEGAKFDVCATYKRIMQNKEVRSLQCERETVIPSAETHLIQAIATACRYPHVDGVDNQIKRFVIFSPMLEPSMLTSMFC